MKQKAKETKPSTVKTKASWEKASRAQFFLPTALILIFVLIFSVIFFNALWSGTQEKTASGSCERTGIDNLIVSTNKISYAPGEKISLQIENRGDAVAYFEPCKDIDVFEKQENGTWVLQQEQKILFNYEQGQFEKKDGDVECEIELPKGAAGVYRLVMPVFYGCTKPSQYACEGSQIFRSNSFEVASGAAPAESAGE
jgi:hypothetical protein